MQIACENLASSTLQFALPGKGSLTLVGVVANTPLGEKTI